MTLYSYSDDRLYIHHSLDKTPDPTQFPMHVHEKCELFCFISGKGYYTVEGNDYALAPGSVMLMRGSEAHKLHIEPDVPYERFVIHFSPEAVLTHESPIRSFLYSRPLGKNNMISCSSASFSFISSCFDRIKRAVSRTSPSDEITSYLTCVLYELTYSAKNVEGKAQPKKNSAENIVSNIISYINSNLADIKNMNFTEQNFYFSRSYLNRIFKDSTGSTIWDYVILKRLMSARSLIQNGKPALAAASECGFADYSSFYRQYKQKFGTSPAKDKKQSR